MPILWRILGFAAIAVITRAVLGTVGGRAKTKGDTRVLGYSASAKFIAAVLVVIATALVVSLAFLMARGPGDKLLGNAAGWKLAGYLTLGGLWIAVLLFALERFLTRIVFDDKMIYVRSPWRRMRAIPWTDALSCEVTLRNASSFSDIPAVYRTVVVRTRSHGKIRIGAFMFGVDTFLATYREKTAPRPFPDEDGLPDDEVCDSAGPSALREHSGPDGLPPGKARLNECESCGKRKVTTELAGRQLCLACLRAVARTSTTRSRGDATTPGKGAGREME